MATTITATPQPGTASVLLEITADALSSPVSVLDLDADGIEAEVYAGGSPWDLYGGECVSDGGLASFPLAGGQVDRVLSGLTVGAVYRVTLDALRSSRNAFLAVVGAGSVEIPTGSEVKASVLTFTATATTHTLRLSSAFAIPSVARLRLDQMPDDYALSIIRSDANGVRAVRLRQDEDLIGGELIVTDYEPALTGPLTYTVTTTETATTSTALDLDQVWLTVPVVPTYSERLSLVTGYTAESQSATTVHTVINREDPVLTLGRLRLRTGVLEVWCATYTTARAVRGVYARGEVVMLRQADYPGLDMYHALTGTLTQEPHPENTETQRWRVAVEYTEVAPPTAPLAGALGWTYAESTARNPTYAASAAEFPTYGDLYVGPVA